MNRTNTNSPRGTLPHRQELRNKLIRMQRINETPHPYYALSSPRSSVFSRSISSCFESVQTCFRSGLNNVTVQACRYLTK